MNIQTALEKLVCYGLAAGLIENADGIYTANRLLELLHIDALEPETEQAILEDIRRRDQLDSTRKEAPLRPAEDAHHIDSSSLTVDEVVDSIVRLMEEVG